MTKIIFLVCLGIMSVLLYVFSSHFIEFLIKNNLRLEIHQPNILRGWTDLIILMGMVLTEC